MTEVRTPSCLLPLALALATAGAAAQETQVQPQAPLQLAQTERQRQIVINDGNETRRYAFNEMGHERVVKGAPYCAEAVHETVQWLPDAGGAGASNRIVHQQSTRLCRDGEGRTRQEVDRGGRKLVYLRDPVAHEDWVLDPERKTARRSAEMPIPGGDGGPDNAGWRDYAERMREWARDFSERARSVAQASRHGAAGSAAERAAPVPPVPPMPPTPPTPVVITRPEGGGTAREVSIVRMQRDGNAEMPGDWAMPPPAVQWRAQSLAPRGGGAVSPLGSKDIDGLRANGERTAWVIEAGKVGNERPIQITREVWTAPELMVTVLSRDFDPRSGEVSYRLKNLKRGEPDPALMRVPAEFNKGSRPRGAAPASAPAG